MDFDDAIGDSEMTRLDEPTTQDAVQVLQASTARARLVGYGKRAGTTAIRIAFSRWGCVFALALLATPYVCIQLNDQARLNSIHKMFPTVRIGDTRETVRDKLGSAVRSFPASKTPGLFSDSRHRLVYGKKHRCLPNWDPLRGRHFGFGIDRVRTFGPDRDDYVVYFDSDGRVCSLDTPARY